MDRRRLLRLAASAGAAGLTGLAGCAGGGDDADGRTVNPALRSTPTVSPTPTAAPTATGVGENERLNRARSVVVSNRLVRPERVYLGVLAGDRTVLETTFRVPAVGGTSVTGVLDRARTYWVAVRAADGRTNTFEWTPPPAGADLAIDLDAGITVRDGYDADAARGFVGQATGDVFAGRSGGVPLVLDNPGPARTVRVSTSDGDGSPSADVRMPANARVPLSLSVPEGRSIVSVRTADGSDRYGWRPTMHGALYCRIDPAPRLSCDLLVRDLLVMNDRSDDGEVRVRVHADGDLTVDRTLYPAAGRVVRLRTAVPPAGTYVLTATDADERRRSRTIRCPARGSFVVRVDGDDITLGAAAVDGRGEIQGDESEEETGEGEAETGEDKTEAGKATTTEPTDTTATETDETG